MKIRLLWLGRTRQSWVREGVEAYLGRIGGYVSVEVCEVREGGSGRAETRVEQEGERLLRRLPAVGYTVVLDAGGTQVDSARIARMVGDRMLEGRDLAFVLGSVDGLPPAVRQRADMVLGLSRLTLPHDLARLVLAEQIYRALTILNDHPYHR